MRTVGLRIKSGLAIAVAIRAAPGGWCIEQRLELPLTEGSDPYARFPLHPLIELAGERGTRASRAAVATVEAVSRRVLAAALRELGELQAAAVIVGSLRDPQRITNPHIRIHAQEGQLFREVVVRALERRKIPHQCLLSSQVLASAAQLRGCPPETLRAAVAAAGRGAVQPWRADEKLAALGALCQLRAAPGDGD